MDPMGKKHNDNLGVAPATNTAKWRFSAGSPTKNVIILIVTVTERGPHPNEN